MTIGDIGMWQKDGNLSIIDRKKDLVKLSHGNPHLPPSMICQSNSHIDYRLILMGYDDDDDDDDDDGY
jgi:hypothetical protein